MRRRSRYSPRARKFVARKIRLAAHEGIEAPRRIARALSMARARGLKVPRKPNVGVPEEGPAEHLRNALALIRAKAQLSQKFGESVTMDERDMDAVVARILKALAQLEGGGTTRLRSNPTLAILNPRRSNPRVEDAAIATWAKIEYMRPDDPDGKNIVRVHEFNDGFEIGWLSDGSVQLSHPKHPLWVEDHE